MSFEVIEVENDVYRIENGGVRALLFLGEDMDMLVDSCMEPGIRFVIKSMTAKPVMLVNTHADPDHIGGNGEFALIFMHSDDIPMYCANEPGGKKAEPLSDGDVISLGNRRFEVIGIPGHTPGSIALLDRERRVLVSGDSVSDAPIYMFGEHRNMEKLHESLKKLWEMSDAYDTVYPSHGSFPLGKDAVKKCLDGAELVLKGEYTVSEPPIAIPAKLVTAGEGKFFMDVR